MSFIDAVNWPEGQNEYRSGAADKTSSSNDCSVSQESLQFDTNLMLMEHANSEGEAFFIV